MTQQPWEAIVAKKQAQVAAALPDEWRLPQAVIDEAKANPTAGVMHIPAKCGLLTAKEIEITENYDAVGLLESMASRKLTAYEVTLAFCKRAAIAQQLLSCLTEMFFDRALERAKELDKYIEENGKPMGPFHGLPISVKDMLNLKGVHTTIGYVSFIKDEPSDFNSYLIDILLSQGAVFYVKTNIPQTMMICDSVNNVFGRVLNPHNLNLTAGGSSGGEGALIAFRGSVLGVGTDVGGSVRIPALCCGTFGFRPTSKRIPNGLFTSSGRAGSPGIYSVAGPLATSARDLTYFMETVIKAKPWDIDPAARATHWRSVEEKKSLKIGVIIEDPDFKVAPPIKRAISQAAEKLKSAGHSVALLENVPSLTEDTKLGMELFRLDNKATPYSYITDSGEPPVPPVAETYTGAFVGKASKTIDDIYDLNVKRADAIAAWHKVFLRDGLDVLITPGNANTAIPHDTYGMPPYTLIWNVMDYPSAVIPYLKADSSIDTNDPNIPSYNADNVHGAPAHIQVVARSDYDEELAYAVQLIDQALKS